MTPEDQRDIEDKYGENVYRPGEDIEKYKDLTEDEKSERRREIEAVFAGRIE